MTSAHLAVLDHDRLNGQPRQERSRFERQQALAVAGGALGAKADEGQEWLWKLQLRRNGAEQQWLRCGLLSQHQQQLLMRQDGSGSSTGRGSCRRRSRAAKGNRMGDAHLCMGSTPEG